ncbi:MAG: anti sigma factor C-terminal domain-containing protein [Acetivibrio sp.]
MKDNADNICDTNKEEELNELFSEEIFDAPMEHDLFREAKQKSYLRIALTSFLVGTLMVFLAILVVIQLRPHLLNKQIIKVSDQYSVQGANLHVGSWTSTYKLGDTFATAPRYKLVEGIPVFEGTLRVPGTDVYPTFQKNVSDDWLKNQYQTVYTTYGSKVMQFLWPQGNYEGSILEFEKVDLLREGEVAEFGISFDQTYSYQEVLAMLPKGVDLAWCWVDTLHGDSNGAEADGCGLIQDESELYGFSATDSLPQSMELFGEITGIPVTKDSKNLAGMVVTGNKEELSLLKNKSFVRSASLGAVVTVY